MDPTWFLAITYSFIFGAMFGDIGQGLLLFLGGIILYKVKHIDLAGIIACAGVFSTFFGFFFTYGSLFGFEEVLHAFWLKPMSAMMNVPLVGRLNVVFVVAIGFGMLLILVCMIFNIIIPFTAKTLKKSGLTATLWQDLYFTALSSLFWDCLFPAKSFRQPPFSLSARCTPSSHVFEGAAHQSGGEKSTYLPGEKGHVFCPKLL